MTDSLAHRGPTDRGTWANGRIALGNRRLAVIDLSTAGHQPMPSEDGRVHITYNGEVYNFRELRERHYLRERGHVFRSGTDTEVLLHLFEEIGPDMFAKLNGMFAMAIWDGRDETLYLARDRFGIKPLFYQRDADHLRFGSEIKAILTDPRVPRRPSLQALHDYLSFAYVPGAQTAFDEILEIPPGHFLVARTNGETKLRRYWDPSLEIDESIDERVAVGRAGELLDKAVHRQLVADVPIGVLLSGGLDSSALVALTARHSSRPLHTYAIGFDEPSFDERPYARRVADHYRTLHREVVITANMVREMLPSYLSHIDEPYADGSAIPTYFVSELAARDVVVVLSGEGGDEVFGGYETYAAFQVSRWFRRVPLWLRKAVVTPLVSKLPVSHTKLSLEFRLKRFLGGQDLSPAQAHLWWRVVLTEAEKLALYSPDVLEQFRAQESVRHFDQVLTHNRSGDTLAGLMLADTLVFLPDDLMIKNDRMTMAHSLEARVPMTDLDLVDFMRTVPSSVKLPRLQKKRILRKAMEGLLPPSILNKKKVGLEMPYSSWLRGELRDVLQTWLAPDRIDGSRLFRPTAIQALVDDHLDGRRDNGRALWGLVNFMMWRELYGVA